MTQSSVASTADATAKDSPADRTGAVSKNYVTVRFQGFLNERLHLVSAEQPVRTAGERTSWQDVDSISQ